VHPSRALALEVVVREHLYVAELDAGSPGSLADVHETRDVVARLVTLARHVDDLVAGVGPVGRGPVVVHDRFEAHRRRDVTEDRSRGGVPAVVLVFVLGARRRKLSARGDRLAAGEHAGAQDALHVRSTFDLWSLHHGRNGGQSGR